VRIDYQPIDQEPTPLGLLSLHRYRAESGEEGYEIRIDGAFLMASHGAVGEHAMARLAHEKLVGGPSLRRPGPWRVLVGGLGAGHTLRAVLDLPGVEEVLVCELGARVVEWNRRYFSVVNGGAVDDPRVRIHVGDVAELLPTCVGAFDLLLLDVDNGPGWLASDRNGGLYAPSGLEASRRALRPGGVLAIWSPEPNEALRATLQAHLGWVHEARVHTDAAGAPALPDVVYLATADAE
jgi:spermidine synthase